MNLLSRNELPASEAGAVGVACRDLNLVAGQFPSLTEDQVDADLQFDLAHFRARTAVNCFFAWLDAVPPDSDARSL